MEPNIEGQYIGIFERNRTLSTLELILNNAGFSEESNRTDFYAIYFGNFSDQTNFLNFDDNQLLITTEFDMLICREKAAINILSLMIILLIQ
ncbi:hypothetical protein JM83_2538 [Gillisia sp. Hel_I_86]|nr:hypothetical protein JM83_2538 [Gillisia sp. Hel_I_86]